MAKEPVTYSEEVFIVICAKLAEGRSLASICRDDDMPHISNVFRWLAADKTGDLRDRYMRAREAQADLMAEEILEIADDGRNDFVESEKGPAFVAEHVQRSRLRVDARKWLAAKLKPKVYGERLLNEHTGRDGGPIETRALSDEEVARRLRELERRKEIGE